METTPIDSRDVFLIGGPRHGQTIRLAFSTKQYVDLRSGTTYTVQMFARPTMSPLGVQSGLRAHDVLVMDGLLGGRTFSEQQARKQQVQNLIADVVVGRWFAHEGYEVTPQGTRAPAPPPSNNGHVVISTDPKEGSDGD